MRTIPFNIVGFDLDGTLLDTSFELSKSLNYALEGESVRGIEPEELRPIIGQGARYMIGYALKDTYGVSNARIERLRLKMLNHYEKNLGANSPLYPGLLTTLEDLKEAGVRIAVVTNKLEHLAVNLLKRVGIIERFSAVIGGDTMGPGRAKPERDSLDEMVRLCGDTGAVDRACFIGDSVFDIEAAQRAGMPSIAVRFGFLDRPVEELRADAIIDHYDELIDTLCRVEHRGNI